MCYMKSLNKVRDTRSLMKHLFKSISSWHQIFIVWSSYAWLFKTCFILDRKKDLVKLSAGEYVSLSKVEAALKQSPLIDNCCLYCDSTKFFPVVLIIPNPKHLKLLGETLGIATEKVEDLCNNPDVIKETLKEIERISKQCKYFVTIFSDVFDLWKKTWLPLS